MTPISHLISCFSLSLSRTHARPSLETKGGGGLHLRGKQIHYSQMRRRVCGGRDFKGLWILKPLVSNNTITSELSETFHGRGFMKNTLVGASRGRGGGARLMVSKDPRGRKKSNIFMVVETNSTSIFGFLICWFFLPWVGCSLLSAWRTCTATAAEKLVFGILPGARDGVKSHTVKEKTRLFFFLSYFQLKHSNWKTSESSH